MIMEVLLLFLLTFFVGIVIYRDINKKDDYAYINQTHRIRSLHIMAEEEPEKFSKMILDISKKINKNKLTS